MKFLFKLFRALNSAQSPWQVTLAIVLGMVAGLTPLDGLQNIVFLFLAFVLNIHLGLFFLSAALFAGVGYLFDPWFERLGYALLSAENLQGLWTSWYNSGVMRLTHFNNTLVMGATVASLLFALPLYLLLGWLIRRYRSGLGAFLARFPLFGTFGFLNAAEEKHAALRWWGAGVFVIVGGGIAGITLLLVDPLLKWGIEKGGSAALQRDVRVGAVETDLSRGAFSIRRLEVAGKEEGVDAVSADLVRFDAALSDLLLDRIHIEKMLISGVGFNTPATLKKAAAPETGAEGTKQKKALELPTFSFPDPKSLIAKADLESVKVYENAQEQIESIRARWEKTAETDLSKDALSELQLDLERLKTMSRSKDPQELVKLAGEVKTFKSKIEARKKALEAIKSDFKSDQKRITALIKEVKEAPLKDYNRLKSAYTLDGSGGMNVIGTLFGEKIKTYLAQARKYYALVRPYLSRDNPPEAAVPPRGEGRWMRYPLTVPSPEFLVALTEIDGIFKSQAFAAQIRDIADNQKALGRPLTFTASSDGPTVKGLRLEGEDNRLGETVIDRVTFEAKRLPIGGLALDPVLIGHSNVALSGGLTLTDASALGGEGRFAFSDARILTEGMTGKMGEIVSGILSDITAFNIDATLGGTLTAPAIGVKTDLDRRISQGVGKAMGKELEAYRGELKSGLTAQTGARLDALKGTEAGIVDINTLVGEQNSMLGDLSSQATGLAGGSGGVKGLLPF
jgi:uncharacterized protein (TIGR03545 family)/uncharacterized protein (TIGR03546 family)